ncbi:hypothetical protein M885DRAFT_510989 [Pelagophyceae sp. CCMP2097]|nr:hypothetical protein M885DRAFT_510989 [Pelagophyceae sp. CCMP2097]
MTAPRVAILGMGKMGAAMACRLASLGHSIVVWNRSPAAPLQVVQDAAGMNGKIVVAQTPHDALQLAGREALALFILSDTAAVEGVLRCEDGAGTFAALAKSRGVTVCNITSGSPDEGRAVAAVVRCETYVDGSYCGPPARARNGTGQLFLSSAAGPAKVEAFRDVFDALGEATFCGDSVGAARALDYAVVDLAFVSYLSYCANAAMLDREGVPAALVAKSAARRLAYVPAALELAAQRMETRDSYHTAPTATLSTWRNFWDSRRAYFVRCGMPSQLLDFAVGLLDQAGASDPNLGSADVTRLQEIVRYGAPPAAAPPAPAAPAS